MNGGGVGGGTPTKLGECTACGETFPIHRPDDEWHPVGTDGSCSCGNDEFVPFDAT